MVPSCIAIIGGIHVMGPTGHMSLLLTHMLAPTRLRATIKYSFEWYWVKGTLN